MPRPASGILCKMGDRVYLYLLGALTASIVALFVLIGVMNREKDALAYQKAVTAAYAKSLNDCQRLLTQRGNEIEHCMDESEELANELAQRGFRCVR